MHYSPPSTTSYVLVCDMQKINVFWRTVKSVRIRSYSGPYFPAFGLNTEYLSAFSVFSPSAEKYGPEYLRKRTLFTQRQ